MPSTSLSERGCDGHRQVAIGDGLGGVGLLAQVLDRALEGGGQAADLVVGLDVDADVDVTLGDALGGLGDGADRLGEQVRDPHDHEADQDQRDQADDEQRGLQALDRGEHLGLRDGREEAPARGVDLRPREDDVLARERVLGLDLAALAGRDRVRDLLELGVVGLVGELGEADLAGLRLVRAGDQDALGRGGERVAGLVELQLAHLAVDQRERVGRAGVADDLAAALDGRLVGHVHRALVGGGLLRRPAWGP